MLCDEVETVGWFTYLGDSLSVVGGYEAAVMVRTRCGWVKFWECGELLYGRRFLLRLKGVVCRSHAWPSTLYSFEVWSLKENVMVICST